MSRQRIERRLLDVHARLMRAREELAVLDAQLVAFNDTADETRVRALVSASPEATKDHREAQRHAEAMARSRFAALASIAELEKVQGELLDRLVPESR